MLLGYFSRFPDGVSRTKSPVLCLCFFNMAKVSGQTAEGVKNGDPI